MGYGGGSMIGGLLVSLIFMALGIWMTWRIIEKAGYPGWYALAIGVGGFILGLIPIIGFLVSLAQLALLYAFAFVRWPKEGGTIPFGGGIPGLAPAPGGYPPPAGYPPATGYPPQPGYPQQPGYPPQAGYPGYPPPGQPPGYPPQPYGQPPGYPPVGGGPGGYGQPPVPPPGAGGYGQPPVAPPPGPAGYGQPPVAPPPGPGGYGQPPIAPPPGYGQSPVAPPPGASPLSGAPSAQPTPPAGGELEATVIAGRAMPSAATPPSPPPSPGASPPMAPGAAPGWTLSTPGPGGAPFVLTLAEGKALYVVSGQGGGGDLIVPEASIGNPHARLHLASGRLGLEDLGSPGGTAIDGAQLLPSHGIREITQSKKIRFGALEFTLARA